MTPCQLLSEALGQTPHVFALLFGSATRGPAYRDFDVAIMGGPTELGERLALGVRLEAAVKFPVDLVHLEQAPLALQFEASKGQLLTVSDPEALADWKERTWSEYFDRQHFFQSYAREMLQARAQMA